MTCSKCNPIIEVLEKTDPEGKEAIGTLLCVLAKLIASTDKPELALKRAVDCLEQSTEMYAAQLEGRMQVFSGTLEELFEYILPRSGKGKLDS